MKKTMKFGNSFIDYNRPPIDADNMDFHQATVMCGLLARVEPTHRKKLYETVSHYKNLMDAVCSADTQKIIEVNGGEKNLLPAPAGMVAVILDEAYTVCYVFNGAGGGQFDPRYLVVFGGVMRVANDVIGFRGIDHLH